MSQHVEIADDLVAKLNAGSFSQTFTAVRGYLFDKDALTGKDLFVGVGLGDSSTNINISSQRSTGKDYVLLVWVIKRFSEAGVISEVAEVDAMQTLVEEINDLIEANELHEALVLQDLDGNEAVWMNTETQMRDTEDASQLNQFTMISQYTFRAWR